jgi:hypothetical protein
MIILVTLTHSLTHSLSAVVAAALFNFAARTALVLQNVSTRAFNPKKTIC